MMDSLCQTPHASHIVANQKKTTSTTFSKFVCLESSHLKTKITWQTTTRQKFKRFRRKSSNVQQECRLLLESGFSCDICIVTDSQPLIPTDSPSNMGPLESKSTIHRKTMALCSYCPQPTTFTNSVKQSSSKPPSSLKTSIKKIKFVIT